MVKLSDSSTEPQFMEKTNTTFTDNGFSSLKERLEQARKEGKIKLTNPSTLFEPDVGEALKARRCFLCGNRLYQTRDKKHWYCRSKGKHKEKVWISNEKMP